MNQNHSDNKAKAYFESAFERISTLKLTPNPAMFELWYVHFSGENPALSHEIDMMEKAGVITADQCDDLYKKYLDSERHAEQVQKAGDRVQTTIRDVNELVSDVKKSTTAYSGTLDNVSVKLSEGEYSQSDVQVFLQDISEDTKSLLKKNERLEEELSRQSDAMMAMQKDLRDAQKEMMLDGLTSVANRKAFDNKMIELIDDCSLQDDVTFSLIFMDIDHFKAFNDNYGHQVGDQVLRLVARTLIDGVKGQDFVARYGGEEFAILLPGTNQEAALVVAENLRKAVAAKEVVNRNSGQAMGRITLSGGVSEFYLGDTSGSIIERADEALYKSKNSGRNNITLSGASGAHANQA